MAFGPQRTGISNTPSIRPSSNPLSPSLAKSAQKLGGFIADPSPQKGLAFVKSLSGTLFEHKNGKPDVIGERQAGMPTYNSLNGLANGEASSQVAGDLSKVAGSRVTNSEALNTAATLAQGIAAQKPDKAFTGDDIRRVLNNPDVASSLNPEFKASFNTLADNLDSKQNSTAAETATASQANRNQFAYNSPGQSAQEQSQENQEELEKLSDWGDTGASLA